MGAEFKNAKILFCHYLYISWVKNTWEKIFKKKKKKRTIIQLLMNNQLTCFVPIFAAAILWTTMKCHQGE